MDSYDILKLSNVAYVMNQNVSAQVELSAMLTANKEREAHNESPAYSYEQMIELIDKYQLHHNATITNLNNGL